jgi:hypothetical protein
MRARQVFAAACVALTTTPLFAHDFWIEPTRLEPEVGQSAGLRLRVGERLAGDAGPRLATHIKRFVVAAGDAAEPQPLAGRRGDDPAGSVRATAPGLHVVGYRSHPSGVELPPENSTPTCAAKGSTQSLRKALHGRRRPLRARCQ